MSSISHVDVLLFSHPHSLALELLHSADVDPAFNLLSPTAVSLALSSTTVFQPSLMIADVYPVPSHPKLSFSSLVYFHDASHSSTTALDTSRRYITSLLQHSPTTVPLLLVLYSNHTAAVDEQHCVDYDTLFSAFQCEKLLNPLHVVPFRQGGGRESEEAVLAFQWLHNILHPTVASSSDSTSVRWSSSTSIAPLLTPHLPAELVSLTLSYLSCSTRGAFLSESEYKAQQMQLQHLREAAERKQQRKELLRFLHAYSCHQTRHESEDDATFALAFTTSPAPFLYPNSSYAHLDLLRLVWHAMTQHGIRNGAAIGWKQMHELLDMEISKRLLGHWAMECLPPIDRRPLNGADEVERWQREQRQAKEQQARTRRILHTTRWACIIQHLANLIQHSHSTHPTHHHYALLPDEHTTATTTSTDTAALEPEGDAVPQCWSSFASFLQNHPQLLTLAFVDDYYTAARLDSYTSWTTVLPADKRSMRYWLPVLQELMESVEVEEVSVRVTRLEDTLVRLDRALDVLVRA